MWEFCCSKSSPPWYFQLSCFCLKFYPFINRYIVVLICVYLVTNGIEHLLMCLFATQMPSLVKYLLKPFAHFCTGFFSCYWILRGIYIFHIHIYIYISLIKQLFGKYFLSVQLDILFFISFFQIADILNFDGIKHTDFFLLWIMFLMLYQINLRST